jgi:hypothetical protein
VELKFSGIAAELWLSLHNRCPIRLRMAEALKDFAGLIMALVAVSAVAYAPSSTREEQKPSASAAGENTHRVPGLSLEATVSTGQE